MDIKQWNRGMDPTLLDLGKIFLEATGEYRIETATSVAGALSLLGTKPMMQSFPITRCRQRWYRSPAGREVIGKRYPLHSLHGKGGRRDRHQGVLRIDISESEITKKGTGAKNPAHTIHKEANKPWNEC
jgi:hypothetical protein